MALFFSFLAASNSADQGLPLLVWLLLAGMLILIIETLRTSLLRRRTQLEVQEAALRAAERGAEELFQMLTQRLSRLDRAFAASFLIREFQPADLAGLQDLEAQIQAKGQIPPDAGGGELEMALLGGKHRFLVVQERSGGRIIGCCGIGRHAIPNDHIFDLIFWFVQPDFQRRGIGTLLLAGVLLWLRKAHANSSLPILHFEALFPTQKYFQAVEALWSEELPGYEGFSRRQERISLAYSVSRRLSEFLIGNKFEIPMPQVVLPRFADQHR